MSELCPAAAARELAETLADALDGGASAQSVEPDVARLVDAIRALDLTYADPYTVKYLLAGALDMAAAAAPTPRATPVSMSIALETVGQALDRYLEARVLGDDRPLSEVIHWLLDTTHLSASGLADLRLGRGCWRGLWLN